MKGYEVPKDMARVILKVPPLESLDGLVFLSNCAETHRGQETFFDVLERPKAFIPVKQAAGPSVLVRKEAIHWAQVLEPERVEWVFYEERIGAPVEKIRCRFDDGEELEGSISIVAPEGRRRVSDFLNQHQGFLHLEADGAMYLVNLSHVTAVDLVGESHGGAR
jgi:hypothetical protein